MNAVPAMDGAASVLGIKYVDSIDFTVLVVFIAGGMEGIVTCNWTRTPIVKCKDYWHLSGLFDTQD